MEELFGYLTESEKQDIITEAKADIRYEKLSNMWDMIERNRNINMMEAELKVLAENGTEDDLTELLEANEQEAGEKKKGLLSSIFGAIASIFRSISDGIKNLFNKNKINPNDVVEVDKDVLDAANKSDSVFGKIKEFLSNIQSKNWVKALELAAAVIAAIATFIGIWNKRKPDKAVHPIKITKGKLKGVLDKITKKNDETSQSLDNAGASADSADSQKQGPIKNALNKIRDFAKHPIKGIINFITARLGLAARDAVVNAGVNAARDAINNAANTDSGLSKTGNNPDNIQAAIDNLTADRKELKNQIKNERDKNKKKDLQKKYDTLINTINEYKRKIKTVQQETSDDIEDFDDYMIEDGINSDNINIFGFDLDDTSVLEESEELDMELEELKNMLIDF